MESTNKKLNTEKLKKVFNKNNIKVIIPIIVLLVLLIVVFIYFGVYKYNNYRNKLVDNFYQYTEKDKLEYEASVSLDRHKVIKSFVPNGYNISFDSTPIYYKDKSSVILPSNMSIIFPLKKMMQYRVNELSYIEKVNNIYYFNTIDFSKNVDHFIMFDGGDLYLFSDSVSFKINGEDITLSPLSYVKATNGEITYYDYESDTINIVNINDSLVVSNEYYSVNVSYDNIEFYGSKLLLTGNLDYLGYLKDE